MLVMLVQPRKDSSERVVTLLGIVMLVRPVQPENANSLMPVTLLSFAKITEVMVVSPCTQDAGISPVFVEPTWTPEELKALEVVMGAAPPEMGFLALAIPKAIESRGIKLQYNHNPGT